MLYHKKLINKIIFPREEFAERRGFIMSFLAFGIKIQDVYIISRLNESINIFDIIEPYISAKFLPYLEFHIADHCNLNCHACGHCSSLVRKPVFPVFEKLSQDFLQLHKFIDDIGKIRIMGGEPLLNPEINKYIKMIRQIYPYTDIRVVTNAILLQKMPEDFFSTLRTYDATIDISIYPPMKSKIPEIKNFLDYKNVKISMTVSKDDFFKGKLIHPHSNSAKTFMECESSMCNFLYDGKFSVCGAPFSNKYFNEYFKQNLPTDGFIDLYDESLTTEKLKMFLLKPINECAYCQRPAKIFKWKPFKHPVELSDWVAEDL